MIILVELANAEIYLDDFLFVREIASCFFEVMYWDNIVRIYSPKSLRSNIVSLISFGGSLESGLSPLDLTLEGREERELRLIGGYLFLFWACRASVLRAGVSFELTGFYLLDGRPQDDQRRWILQGI